MLDDVATAKQEHVVTGVEGRAERSEGTERVERKALVLELEDLKVIDLLELTSYYMIYMWSTYKASV